MVGEALCEGFPVNRKIKDHISQLLSHSKQIYKTSQVAR